MVAIQSGRELEQFDENKSYDSGKIRIKILKFNLEKKRQ